MWLGPGAEVYACVRSITKGLRNGMLYKIEKVGEQTILESPPSAGVGDIALTKEEASKLLRPSFAQTYAGSQAVTLQGRVELCDTTSPRFTTKMLLMGLSRATAYHLVQVVD